MATQAAGLSQPAAFDPVRGSLKRRFRAWRRITRDRWVLKTIKRGLKLEFSQRPRSMFIPNRPLPERETTWASEEVARLALCGATTPVQRRPHLCLPLGVVPKKNGKLRLIHDLRFLNRHLRLPPHFKLEDLATVAKQAQEGDNMFSVDLESGYYHVEISPAFRQFFGFQWNGQYYVWNVLPFGLSTAPLVFTKILRPVVQHLRQLGPARVNIYLDDFLFLISASEDAMLWRDKMLQALKDFGLHVNFEKSCLTPTKEITYLGMELSTVGRPTFRVPRSKLKILRHEISRLLRETRPFPARRLARLVGSLASVLRAVLPGSMLLRRCYALIDRRDLDRTIALSRGARQDLQWWLRALTDWNGAAAIPLPADVKLETDASDLGWGAAIGSMETRGSWSPEMRRRHINIRELTAVLLGLRSLLSEVKGKSVIVYSDNVTVVASINRLRGKSFFLNEIVRSLFLFCRQHDITLRAQWLPGSSNTRADRLSRMPDPTDWTLADDAWSMIDIVFGPHSMDRMASLNNAKTRRYNSRFRDPAAEAVDCFTQDWTNDNNYVCPPFALIPRILRLIEEQHATATIIVPVWPSAWWWGRLCSLSVAAPLPLPASAFLPGPSTSVEPHRNPRWRFAAFRIAG